MATLLDGTPVEAWPSSPLTMVSAPYSYHALTLISRDDHTIRPASGQARRPDAVGNVSSSLVVGLACPDHSDNMKGWHQHFEGKYTVCGELVDRV